jgi:non-specific serine/threonine protein kinase
MGLFMASTAHAGRFQPLPTPLTPLIGREREIAALCDLLRDPSRRAEQACPPIAEQPVRLLTLIGPGGSGKTRLALAVAARLQDAFSDGVAFVSLAAIRDPDLVPSAIAQALGVREAAEQPLAERLKSTLRQHQFLLVLDNFEQLLPAAPLVGELLAACPGLAVLVTSRAVLHLYGEHDVVVAPLALPDPRRLPPLDQLAQVEAVRLFVERARAARGEFALTDANAAAIADICARLDGLPLAIELAASRSRLLSPQALLARLEQRLPVLTGGPRDAPERQQTMRDTIAWSYDLLNADQQRLFRQLAVFAGGWTLEAADAVGGLDLEPSRDATQAVLEGIDALVDHSLVRQIEQSDGSVRFDMLETIREYGRERLDAHAETEVTRRRHAAYFLHTFAPATMSFEATTSGELARADTEHDNVRSALGWALEHDAAAAIRCLETFGVYWWRRGLYSEARRWLEQSLASGRTLPATARASAQHGLSLFATTQGDYAEGQRCGEAALVLYRELDDRPGISNALFGLGRVALFTGDHQRALQLFEECRAVDGDAEVSQAGVFGNLSSAAITGGEYERAAAYLDEGLERARRFGDLAGIALLLERAATLALKMDDAPRARQLLVESLAILQRHQPERRYATQALETCAWLAAVEHQPERAARLLGAVGREREAMGVPVPPSIQAEYDQFVPLATAQIDSAGWDLARSEGAAMTLEEAIAYALQDEPARSPVAAAVPSILSPRELDVLRLLVDGRSNQEIAAVLSISPNTVANHVANIMNKLGLDSRTAVVAWAVRHEIA